MILRWLIRWLASPLTRWRRERALHAEVVARLGVRISELEKERDDSKRPT